MDRLSYIHRRMHGYDNTVECATMNALNVNIQWHCRIINSKHLIKSDKLITYVINDKTNNKGKIISILVNGLK